MGMFLVFLAALGVSILAFELLSFAQHSLSGGFGRKNRLTASYVVGQDIPAGRVSTWRGILIAIFPGRFDGQNLTRAADVVEMLRRAGYPYDTPGEFYAFAVRTFTQFLIVGAVLAAEMVIFDMAAYAPVVALLFSLLGLRQPYSRLKSLARKRADAMRKNMLVGLATLNSLLSAGIGVQEAMRRTSTVGGPFCNLLGLFVSRLAVDDFSKALQITRDHLPNPNDMEMNIFLRDVSDFFENNRPLLNSTLALQESVHRNVVEDTEARSALVKQRSGLFGVFAVVGLVAGIILPFSGGF